MHFKYLSKENVCVLCLKFVFFIFIAKNKVLFNDCLIVKEKSNTEKLNQSSCGTVELGYNIEYPVHTETRSYIPHYVTQLFSIYGLYV